MSRVLVLQLCRFGDVLQTTPMLRGIRSHHPDAHVTLALHDRFRHVPIPSALYDKLVAFPYTDIAAGLARDPACWTAGLEQVRAFIDALGPAPFDLTLNLTHTDLSGYLAAALASTEVRGMVAAPDRPRVIRGDVMTYFWASQLSRAQGCFNLVDLYTWAAGVPAGPGLEVAIPTDARHCMRTWLSDRSLLDRPLICVQLGASDDRKRWPPERFAEAVNLLDPSLGEVVLVGTESERPLGDRFLAAATRPVHSSFGETTIVELAALLEAARLLVTNDTGVMHVAAAVGTRVVDLSTGPVFAHETGPYGAGHLVIEPQMSCFPCVAGADCHHLSCREAFAPTDVAALVRHALGRGPLPRPEGARVLEASVTASGRLEYRPVWSPVADLRDLLRPLTAEIWESLLRPAPHPNGSEPPADERPPRPMSADLPTEAIAGTCAALGRVADHAERAAVLTADLPRVTSTARGRQMAAVDRELDTLRLEAELDPACQSIVSYLRVRLDSTTETDVDRLSGIYARECSQSAQRARQLADRLGAVVASPRHRPAV